MLGPVQAHRDRQPRDGDEPKGLYSKPKEGRRREEVKTESWPKSPSWPETGAENGSHSGLFLQPDSLHHAKFCF